MEKMRRVGRDLVEGMKLGGPRVRAKVFATITLHQLLIHVAEPPDDRDGFVRWVDEVEQGVRIHGPFLTDTTVANMNYNLTLVFFALGELRRALHYNNLVLSGPESRRGLQSYYHARLLQLLIHFELGDFDLLEYLIKSTYRYFRSRNVVYKIENIVLGFFRKLPGVRDRDQLIEAFIELRAELLPLKDDPREGTGFRLFSYIEWLDAKIAAARPASRAPVAG
jgi:hypothetical protein